MIGRLIRSDLPLCAWGKQDCLLHILQRLLALAGLALVIALAPACKRTGQPMPVAAAPIPIATSESISTPQTADRLPPPQPIPPDAIPPEQEPAPVVQPAPAEPPRNLSRPRPTGPGGAATSPVPPPAPSPAPPPSRPPGSNASPPPAVRPLLTAAEEKALHQRIERSLRSAELDLKKMPPNGGSS